jgi:hippurate hydrolase
MNGLLNKMRHSGIRNAACIKFSPRYRVKSLIYFPESGMSDYVIPEIKATEAEMISIRHYLHANPELSLEEFNTSELVASKLTEWGYQVTRGLGKTGVVGSLSKGDSPRTIGLRADMDALPIEETTGLPWASTVPGKMHACGHDGHTTILLAAAKYIASPACQFNGTVHLIFQPAEEAIGGADLMIKDGLFEQFPCERIFGLHNMPGLPVGKLGFYAGNFMASADTVKITITGYGGHGAHPERTVDPIVAGAALVMALQSIVARNVPPGKRQWSASAPSRPVSPPTSFRRAR